MPNDQKALPLSLSLPCRHPQQLFRAFSVRETVSYGWVGLIGVTLDAGAFYLLRRQLQVDPVWATIISATVAALLTFPLNMRITFRKSDRAAARLVKYVAINLFGVALGAAIMYAGHTLQGMRPGVVKAASIVIVAGTQFLLNKFFAFR